MKITEPGQYRVLEDYGYRGTNSIQPFLPGAIITVERVDKLNHKIFVVEFGDWVHWDPPVCRWYGDE